MKANKMLIQAGSLLLAGLVDGQAVHAVKSSNYSGLVVDLGYAKFQGYTNATAGINYWRGIQYAADPSGPLRWQRPVPIEWSNDFDTNKIYDASKIGPACYQSLPQSLYLPYSDSFAATPQGVSENCLTVDVLVPTHPVSTRLPVMVQIHGGGYTSGNAQSYPGDALVNASNGNLIYVSMQYRLGIFGFLSGSQIAQDGVLNAGLLDQRAALDWVQRNIGAFGGDPAKVTIWGGSAGGGSVTYQLMAGGAYDLPPFSGAIAEYPWWQPLLNQSEQEFQYYNALKLSGCSSVNCLRALPAKKLEHLNQAVENASYPGPGVGYGVYDFGPVVDGKFLVELPGTAFQLGHFYDVPLMVDHDAYEGYIFSNMSQKTQSQETRDAQDLFPFAGPAFFSRLYQLYPRPSYNSTFFQRQTWFGDFIINCPTYYMAFNAVERNSNSSAVFKLTFAAGSQLHGATAFFLASSITGFPMANNHTLAEIMASYWISFAVTGDPNPLRTQDAAYWPSYASGGAGSVANGESVGFETLAVTYTTIKAAPDPDANEKCEFFGAHGYDVTN